MTQFPARRKCRALLTATQWCFVEILEFRGLFRAFSLACQDVCHLLAEKIDASSQPKHLMRISLFFKTNVNESAPLATAEIDEKHTG